MQSWLGLVGAMGLVCFARGEVDWKTTFLDNTQSFGVTVGKCTDISSVNSRGKCVANGLLSSNPTYSVWVYPSQSQDGTAVSQEYKAANMFKAIDAMFSSMTMRTRELSTCKMLWERLICDTTYPPCITTPTGSNQPARVCYDNCQQIQQACEPVFELLRNAGLGQYIPLCDDSIGSSSLAMSYMYTYYVQSWRELEAFPFPTFDDQQDDYSHHSYIGCFMANYGSFVEDKKFPWNDPSLCKEFNGAWKELYDPAADQYKFMCEFTSGRDCVNAGGEWKVVFTPGGSGFAGTCFFPNMIKYPPNGGSNSVPLETPWVEEGRVVPNLSGDGFLLPYSLTLKCPEGAESLIAVSRISCNETCDMAKDIPATMRSVDSGLAKKIPCDSIYVIASLGFHYLRLASFATGRAESPSIEWRVETVQGASVPTDTNTVFIRAAVFFDVTDPTKFDAFAFASAVMQTINEKFSYLELRLDQVFVTQITETSVQFEIRVPSGQAQRDVGTLVNDPLFLYPLAERLYDLGLINATDACSAQRQMRVDKDSFQEFVYIEILAGLPAEAVAGIVVASLLFVSCGAGYGYLRLRRVRKAEDEVKRRHAELAAKQQEVDKHVREIETQQKAIAEERKLLKQEQREVEAEAKRAKEEFDALLKAELAKLAPEQAQALEKSEQLQKELLATEGVAKVEELKQTFPDVEPSSEVIELEHALASGDLVVLAEQPERNVASRERVKRAPPAATTRVGRLRSYVNMLDADDGASYLALLEELIREGDLRESEQEDEVAKVRQSYDEAAFKLKSDLYKRKCALEDKISARRKQRLDLITKDAKLSKEEGPARSQQGAEDEQQSEPAKISPELAKVIEEQEDEDYQAALAVIKATVPSQQEFEKSIEKLTKQKEESRQRQVQALARRREEVRKHLEAEEAKLAKQKEATEQRQKELAQRSLSIFKKMSSAESRVAELKRNHESAVQQLENAKQEAKEKQRKKLEERKNKVGTVKIAPLSNDKPSPS